MEPLFAAHVAVFVIAAVLCFASVPRARQITHRGTREGFVAILVTCGLWSVGYLGYFLLSPPSIQVAFYIGGIIAALACVGAWLYFSLAYTGRSPRQLPYRHIVVGVFVFIALLKVTNPIHQLYFTTEAVSEPFSHLALHHGLLHWVVLGFSYVVIGISFFILLERFYYAGADTRPFIILIGITALPIIFNILGATGSSVLPIWYEPIGVAIFALGTLFVYFDRFEAIQFAGEAEEAAIFLDQDDSIRNYNQAARMLFPGLSESVGDPVSTVVPTLASGSDEDQIIEREVAGEDRYYRLSSSAITTGDAVTGRLISITDVTDTERYRKELEVKTEQLEALNRVIRHDIRNDMTVIIGWAQILPEHVDEEGQELLEHVLKKSNHVIEITDIAGDVVDSMTSDDALDLRPVDINQALELEISAARESYPDAEFEIKGELPDVTVEANEMLSSVFRNLLNNAVLHNDEDVPEITIAAEESREIVRIQIEDNGPGVPDEQKEAIFGKGEKGIESSGTGIGLYLAQTLINQFDGDIWIEDNDPKGTIFVIELPIYPPDLISKYHR